MRFVSRGPRSPAVRLVLFNHKGGVGKTLLTANIASALADMLHKRVLVVDADPQCNLTSFFVEESVVDRLLDASDSNEGQTVWSSLKPIVEGSGDATYASPLEVRDNLWLVPGDIRLAEFEQELPSLWAECLQRRPRGFRGTTSLSALVDEAAQETSAEIILYDCGPNIGALNRVILLDCNFFIIPAACDLFSVRAIRTLGRTLETWITDWDTISELAPSGWDRLPGNPRLMGYIPQGFRTYAGAPTAAQSDYISKIELAVRGDVSSVLQRLGIKESGTRPLKIGAVKDFSSLASRSQMRGRPIWELDGTTYEQRDEARGIFLQLALEIAGRAGLPK